MSKTAGGISVFFPCYNEEGNIESLIAKALDVLPALTDDFELIIVNDGSSDATGAVADRLAVDNPLVKVIHHPVNRGYGGALQSGFKAATKELVFYTDGDGQFDLAELADILPLIEDYDIVTCYRKNRRDNIIRKLNAWAWCALVRFMFKLPIKDIDCAFKLYKRQIFDNIEMVSEGALIDTEILARAKRAGYTMTQRGVSHYPRTTGQSSGGNLAVILRAFKELFKLRKQIRKGK